MPYRTRIPGEDLSEQAITGNYVGIPYEKYDCQTLVEKILEDAGIRKADGTVYNWRGSNSMFRNYVRWRGTIAECKQKFGRIPQGAFVFIVKNDGKERDKGYYDDLGNASHVGLYLDGVAVIDSQPTGGVQLRNINIFTHVCLMSMIDYYTEPAKDETPEEQALAAIHTIRDPDSTDTDILRALKVLSTYINKEG